MSAPSALAGANYARAARPAGSPVGAELSDPEIFIAGDSITYGLGFGDATGQAYRTRLGQLLTAAGLSPTMVGPQVSGVAPWDHSRGAAGSTLEDHLTGGAYDSVSLIGGVYAPAPDVVIIALGSNDANDATLTTNFQSNMSTFVAQLAAARAGMRYVICYLNEAGDATKLARMQTINSGLTATIATLAGSHNVVACDLRGTSVQLTHMYPRTGSVNVHPGPIGYAMYADRMFPAVLNACGYDAAWPGVVVT